MTLEQVSAQEIVQLCRGKGFLAKPLFIVHTSPVGGLEDVIPQLEGHLAYQVELERRGIMFAAGPVFSEDGEHWRGDGFVVIRAADLDQARAIAASDPMHACGARRFSVRPWLVNEGTVTIRFNFSDRAGELV